MILSYFYGNLIKRLQGTCVLRSKIHQSSHIGTNCNIIDCSLSRYSYISHDSQFVNTDIGAFCSISDHVDCGDAEHPMEWVSMSPVFQNVKHSGVKARFSNWIYLNINERRLAMMFGCPCIIHGCFEWQMPEFDAIRSGTTGGFLQ